jgi:hypothetical protein
MQTTKQVKEQITKKVYQARVGAPFKQDDAQEIGEFIENCKDKSTNGILKEIIKHPKSKIYSYIEWDTKKASELYQLQRVREIVNHLEIKIIRLGNEEPVYLKVSISAFKSVSPIDAGERIYVPIEEGMTNEFYRTQIIERAKIELRNWINRYNQYQELSVIINTIKKLL